MKHNDYKELSNPRSKMVGDLKRNYLKSGTNKKEVIQLLGPPVDDYRIKLLPNGMTLSDSIVQMCTYKKGRSIDESNSI